MIWTIAQNELRRIWYSPIAWGLFAVALLVLGLLLLLILNNFYSEIQNKLVGMERAPGLTDLVIAPYMFWMAVVGMLLIPLFAVRGSTEERHFGTHLLLGSAPVSPVQIVLGKFFALLLVTLLFTVLCSSHALLLGYFTAIDYGKTLAGMLAVFLFIGSFNAAALLIANLTRTPILATAGIMGTLLVLIMLYLSGSSSASSSALFLYLSNFPHLMNLSSGSVDTTQLAYFVLFTILFLALCVRRLRGGSKNQGMQHRKINVTLRRWLELSAFFAVLVLCAWLTQKFHYTFDWTRDHRNTLTKTSQDVLQLAQDSLLFTVSARSPASERNAIKRQLEKYLKFKPDIDFEFLDPEKQLVLAKELRLTQANQLRIDYQGRFEILNTISEAEITNALQRLTRLRSSWVAFLSGHEERDPLDESAQGYSTLKDSLETSGVQVQRLNLLKTTLIPDNVSVLVLAAPQSTLLAGEEKLIVDFIEKGGNLLWLTDPHTNEDTQTSLITLAGKLGLSWVDGVVIDANQELRSILGIQHPAIVPVVEYQQHAITNNLKNQTLFPFAKGIIVDATDSWQIQPLFYALPGTWSEVGSLSGESVTFSSRDGDINMPLLLAASLSRNLSGRQQRIVVIGDSDFASNAYIGHGANRMLMVSALQWLAHDDQRISLLPYQPPDVSIAFSNTEIAVLAAWYLIVAPLGLLLLGLFIGIYRRRA